MIGFNSVLTTVNNRNKTSIAFGVEQKHFSPNDISSLSQQVMQTLPLGGNVNFKTDDNSQPWGGISEGSRNGARCIEVGSYTPIVLGQNSELQFNNRVRVVQPKNLARPPFITSWKDEETKTYSDAGIEVAQGCLDTAGYILEAYLNNQNQ